MPQPHAENLENSQNLEPLHDYPNLFSDAQEFLALNQQWSETYADECLAEVPQGYEVVATADLAAYDVSANMALVLREYGAETKFIKTDEQNAGTIAEVDIAVPTEALSLWDAATTSKVKGEYSSEEPQYPYRVARAISNGGDQEVANLAFAGDRYLAINMHAIPNSYTLWATHYFRNLELVPMQALLVRAVKDPMEIAEPKKAHYEFLSEIYDATDRKRLWGEAVFNLCNLAFLARLADNPELIAENSLSPEPYAVETAHDVVNLSPEKHTEAADIYFLGGGDVGLKALRALSFHSKHRRN